MTIDKRDFGGRDAGVLEFHGGALLAAEDYYGRALDSHGAGASFDGFEGIFDLKDVAIGGEY